MEYILQPQPENKNKKKKAKKRKGQKDGGDSEEDTKMTRSSATQNSGN